MMYLYPIGTMELRIGNIDRFGLNNCDTCTVVVLVLTCGWYMRGEEKGRASVLSSEGVGREGSS